MPPENNQNPIKQNDLSFDESHFGMRSRATLQVSRAPFMINFLMKKGIVKTENQALTVLLLIAIIFLAAAGFVISRSVAVPTAQINPSFISN